MPALLQPDVARQAAQRRSPRDYQQGYAGVLSRPDAFTSTSGRDAGAAAAARHPTLALVQQRLRQGCSPGARRDGFKLGLVVEGGGMRGIISGAMLMALQDLGLTGVFDAAYGSSAGAINGERQQRVHARTSTVEASAA